ncbi:hypothetical protein KAR91_13810 [Candidatus Pacearchaeota archaeon]|nr:hypothetical protein [Candidatus Pacearchaeota archaeon]
MGLLKRILKLIKSWFNQSHMCQYDYPFDGFQRCMVCGKTIPIPSPGCSHEYKSEKFKILNPVFETLESVKIVMTCNKCGDIKIKTTNIG